MTTKQSLPDERRFKRFVGPKFEKVYDPKSNAFEITGYFTSDGVDKVGDIITKEATQNAIAAFKQFPTLRLMHQPIPCGKVLAIGEPDGLQWNQLKAKVVSDDVKKLVSEDVLTAMSVGIIVKDFEPVDPEQAKDPFWFFSGGLKITSYDLIEISLVDSPANADAILTDHSGKVTIQNQQQAFLFKALPDGIVSQKKEGSSEVQTLLFDKEKFTEAEAKDWAKEHDFKNDKVDVTENKIRLRQFSPDECDPDTYGTKSMTDGVKAVYCVKKSLSAPTVKDISELQQDNLTNITETNQDGKVVKCSNCGKEFDYLSLKEEGMGYVKCPGCGYCVDQNGNATESSPTLDNGRKFVDETKITGEVAPTEVKSSDETAPETLPKAVEKAADMEQMSGKMDECMKKMDDMMKKMDDVMGAMGQEMSHKPDEIKTEQADTEKQAEPAKTESTNVAVEEKANSEVPTAKEVEGFSKVLETVLKDWDARQEKSEKRLLGEIQKVRDYIEELRNKPKEPKAAMLTPTSQLTDGEPEPTAPTDAELVSDKGKRDQYMKSVLAVFEPKNSK